MYRFTFGSMALASALLAPAVSHAQTSCTREGLKAAADLYIAAQARGYLRPIAGSAVAPGSRSHLPVPGRMSHENFDTAIRSRLIDKPLKVD